MPHPAAPVVGHECGVACHSSYTTTGASSLKTPTQEHTQGEGDLARKDCYLEGRRPDAPRRDICRTTPQGLGAGTAHLWDWAGIEEGRRATSGTGT